jgi:hypothetical protein
MTEDIDVKKTEALLKLKLDEQRAILINEAEGQFRFKWHRRDYISGLLLLIVLFGLNPYGDRSSYPNFLKYIDGGVLLLFVAYQLHRISRLERRADAIAKILLRD